MQRFQTTSDNELCFISEWDALTGWYIYLTAGELSLFVYFIHWCILLLLDCKFIKLRAGKLNEMQFMKLDCK